MASDVVGWDSVSFPSAAKCSAWTKAKVKLSQIDDWPSALATEADEETVTVATWLDRWRAFDENPHDLPELIEWKVGPRSASCRLWLTEETFRGAGMVLVAVARSAARAGAKVELVLELDGGKTLSLRDSQLELVSGRAARGLHDSKLVAEIEAEVARRSALAKPKRAPASRADETGVDALLAGVLAPAAKDDRAGERPRCREALQKHPDPRVGPLVIEALESPSRWKPGSSTGALNDAHDCARQLVWLLAGRRERAALPLLLKVFERHPAAELRHVAGRELLKWAEAEHPSAADIVARARSYAPVQKKDAALVRRAVELLAGSQRR